MTVESPITAAVVNFLLTYLLHSSVLFAVCALLAAGFDWWSRSSSGGPYVVKEMLWKGAACAALVTAPWHVWWSQQPSDAARSVATASQPEARVIVIDDGLPSAFPARQRPVLEPSEWTTPNDTERTSTQGFSKELRDATSSSRSAPQRLVDSGGRRPFPPQTASPRAADPRPLPAPAWAVPVETVEIGARAIVAIIVIGLLRAAIFDWRFRRRSRSWESLSAGPASDVLRELTGQLGIKKRIRLMESDGYSEPATFGTLRWTIVLPTGLENHLTRDELRALLAHEVAHLVRGDTRWLWMGRFLCGCLPFQPLNFVARRQWQQAAEFLCDQRAICWGVTPMSLAHCLTRVAEWRLDGHAAAAPVGLRATGTSSTLVKRVERLTSHVNPEASNDHGWTGTVLLGFTVVTLLPVASALPSIPMFDVSPTARTAVETVPRPAQPAASGPLSTAAVSWDDVRSELIGLEEDVRLLEQFATSNVEVASLMAELHRRISVLREQVSADGPTDTVDFRTNNTSPIAKGQFH